ncbi:MAG: class I SAM-dependent RNA methyltransferase [Betaproteobacteria bacterium]|nr:class I SAM-dependent RNA methyltransferase [Betaproteobacteria bacterium]
MMESFFAPCPRGLEAILAQELAALGATEVKATDGGAHFAGPFELCYRANLESRIASRVLWRVAAAFYRNEDDIYQATLALPWSRWFDVGSTIRVNVAALRCPLKSLDFVTLRIKDAVCDVFRGQCGERPSVNTEQPDIRIHAFLTADQLTLYFDTSGEPLFKRGYRRAAGEAPLRENLAAGILRIAGWTPGEPLLDPMCGSGTFLIEAALIALDIAPGARRSFGFEKLKQFDRKTWGGLKAAAQARERPRTALPIYGSDLYGEELKTARANLDAAGLQDVIMLKQANVLEMPAPAASGVIVTNPPYGVRLGETGELAEFYPKLGDALKQKFSGWRAYILSSDMALPRLIRLAASKRTPLFNGALECRLYEFKLVAGSMRRKKPVKGEG